MKSFVIRLKEGDELILKIKDFCAENKIDSAWFSGFGAASSVKLAFYNLAKKEYIRKTYTKPLEIAALSGNLGQMNGKTIIHCHGIFSEENFQTVGGHVDELVIAATCEIVLHQLNIKLERKFDKNIGLNLLDI
ncbi:MAG: DNA-binding protein [Candidatus Berkelbacteria bacterium]|nr:DNA-binding protein [Candidatus Berkelbacteria bacterium]